MSGAFSYKERQKHIINVSRVLFTRNGVENTSVNDIIKELGIAKGTFYWYFESKEQLIHMVVADLINESYQRAEEICQLPELAFTQKLTRILEYLFIDSYAGQDLEQRIQKEYAAFSDQIWQENIRQLTPIVKALVKQAVDEGLTDSECSDDTAAFIIYGFRSVLFNTINRDDPASFEPINRVLAFIFRGLNFHPPLPVLDWEIDREG